MRHSMPPYIDRLRNGSGPFVKFSLRARAVRSCPFIKYTFPTYTHTHTHSDINNAYLTHTRINRKRTHEKHDIYSHKLLCKFIPNTVFTHFNMWCFYILINILECRFICFNAQFKYCPTHSVHIFFSLSMMRGRWHRYVIILVSRARLKCGLKR